MSFESKKFQNEEDLELEPSYEQIREDKLEALSGPLVEGLRMCFDTKQSEQFMQTVVIKNGISIDDLQLVPEESVSEIVKLASNYFELSGNDQKENGGEIAEMISKSVASRKEEK